MQEKKLYLLTYEHGGYVLWKDRVKPRLKEIKKWLEEYPKLKIGLDYESFTFDEFERCDPEVNVLIKELLEKYPDRVGLGATTYGQPLSLTISEESNARQLSYAVRTNMKFFGKTPSVYAISEFALNNQTPQLLKLSGYKAAMLRSHVMGYGYPRTFDSAWGKWIGRDLTEIPAVPTYDKQGRGYNCTTVDNWILSRWPHDSDISLEAFEEMFDRYEPLIASRYDDLTQNIVPVTAHSQEKENCEYILLEDIPELCGEPKDELKTTDNDFHIQMPRGYCGNEIFNGIRKAESSVVQAEELNALAVMLGAPALTEKIDEAWQFLLAAQHHDVTICGLLDLARRFIPTSLKASQEVRKKSLDYILKHFADSEKESVVAINPHSFEIDEWVEKNDGYVHIKSKPYGIQKVTEADEKYDYLWCEENGILDTPCYKIGLNEKGISYIDDKKSNRRILDNGDGELFSAYVEDEFCLSKGEWSVEISDIGASAVQNGEIGGIPYRFEMRFNGNSPRIDCKAKFEMHGEHVGKIGEKAGLNKAVTVNGHIHETKLCLNMNLCLEKDRKMMRDLPYSISEWNGAVRKTEDYWYEKDKIIIDTEVSKEESFNSVTYLDGVYWVALKDSKNGFAVMNRGCMGSVVSGNKLSLPLLYSNEYMCGTVILDGVYDNEFALLPYSSDVADAQIHRNAVAYIYPPIVEKAEKGEGEFKEFTIASLESNGGEVIMTTAYPENDAVLVRFCNYSDEQSDCVFSSAIGKVTAETDLLGNELAEIHNGKMSLRPWEIKTVKIQYK